MTLIEAVNELAGLYGASDPAIESKERVIVSSGGTKKAKALPEPALYLNSDSAIKAWLVEARLIIDGQMVTEGRHTMGYKLIDGPHLDKWHITVTDKSHQQRVAEDRYSVTATLGFA